MEVNVGAEPGGGTETQELTLMMQTLATYDARGQEVIAKVPMMQHVEKGVTEIEKQPSSVYHP